MHEPFDPRKPQNEKDDESSSFEVIPDDEGELTEEDFDFEGEDESLYDDCDLDIDPDPSLCKNGIPLQWLNKSIWVILN